MKPAVQREAPGRCKQPTQLPSSEISSSSVYGFPVAVNQFQLLRDSRSAESQRTEQIKYRSTNQRSARRSRQQAARGTDEQGTSTTEGIFHIVPPMNDAQGNL